MMAALIFALVPVGALQLATRPATARAACLSCAGRAGVIVSQKKSAEEAASLRDQMRAYLDMVGRD